MLVAGLLMLGSVTSAAPVPLEDFAKRQEIFDIELSPDGKHLALTVPQSDKETSLLILDTATLNPTGSLRSGDNMLVGSFWWDDNNRVVVSVAQKFGGFDQPLATGELVAINADGTGITKLFGARGSTQTGSNITGRGSDQGFGFVIDPLPDVEDRIIVGVTPFSSEVPYTDVYSMDTRSGRRKKLARAPIRGSDFLLDQQGELHYAAGTTRDGLQQLYRFVDGEWKLVNDEADSGREIWPLLITDQGVYAEIAEGGPSRMVRWDPDTGEESLIYQGRVADPSRLYTTPDGKALLAVGTAEDRAGLHLVATDHNMAKVIGTPGKQFVGQLVRPNSYSRDGQVALLEVSSDRNSGEFYLFNLKTREARFLLPRDSWLDPETMGELRPITLKSRDGKDLHGYLQLPPGSDGKNLPMIVLPHGGPHGVRDFWRFGRDLQMLASRGYAVLQINFRGSGGYGEDFEIAGHRQWGRAMQDDVTDATRWAIEQGHADPDRICIYGASYGGYAALMGAAREPDLYRCAVSYVGVTDLKLMYREGDIAERAYGRAFLDRVLGGDEAELAANSPVSHADKIKAAVMLVHGGEDFRVPISHAERMRDALKAAGKEPEWFVKPKEGHGFYRQEHVQELNQRLIAFFDQHIGSKE